MKKITLLLLCLSAITCNGQYFLLLNNGRKVEMKSWNVLDNGSVKVKSVSKEILEFQASQILGYCDLRYEYIRYFKEVPVSNGSKLFLFLDLIEDGEVRIYEHVHRSSKATHITVYGERKNEIVELWKSELTFSSYKKRRLNNLKLLFKDDPKLTTGIDSGIIHTSYRDIAKIARKYNLMRFKPREATGNMSQVSFYLTSKSSLSLQLVINDSTKHELKYGEVVSVSLPSDFGSKVCIGNQCAFIRSSPCFTKYFFVNIEKDGELSFEVVTSGKAKEKFN